MTAHKKIKAAWLIVRNYALLECVGMLFAFITSGMSLIQPYILKEIIDFILLGDINNANDMIIALIVVFGVSKVIGIANTYLFTYIGEGVLYDCRVEVHNKALNRGGSHEETAGSVHSKILKELPQVVNLVTDTLINLIINLFTLIVTFVLVYVLDPKVALYLAIALPAVAIVIIVFNPLLKRINSVLLDEYARINGVLMENLTNRKGVLYTNTSSYALKRFSDRLRSYIRLKFKRLLLNVISKHLLEVIYFIPTVLLLIYGVSAIENDTMTIGTLIALSSYINRFFSPLKILTNINFSLQQSIVSFERYLEYLSDDKRDDRYLECRKLENVCLRNIFFSYGSNTILNDFSYSFKRGEITLILGENGVGKSTLIDLISGVVLPDKGEVVYDGVNLSSIKVDNIANLVGVVSQHPYLYSDTIKNNVVLGRDISEEDVLELGRQLGFNDILAGDDLNTSSILSEFGSNLSGGQMRKLSVLQGIIGDSELLIYDEPLANLDEKARGNMIEYIKSQKDTRITIVISHENRYEFADNVIVLE